MDIIYSIILLFFLCPSLRHTDPPPPMPCCYACQSSGRPGALGSPAALLTADVRRPLFFGNSPSVFFCVCLQLFRRLCYRIFVFIRQTLTHTTNSFILIHFGFSSTFVRRLFRSLILHRSNFEEFFLGDSFFILDRD